VGCSGHKCLVKSRFHYETSETSPNPRDTCHWEVSRKSVICHGEVTDMDHVMGKSLLGFQTIATCRDGLKNSCDKLATSLFASEKQGKSATSRTNQRHDGLWA